MCLHIESGGGGRSESAALTLFSMCAPDKSSLKRKAPSPLWSTLSAEQPIAAAFEGRVRVWGGGPRSESVGPNNDSMSLSYKYIISLRWRQQLVIGFGYKSFITPHINN